VKVKKDNTKHISDVLVMDHWLPVFFSVHNIMSWSASYVFWCWKL